MLDFLRRIPELLGLKRKPAASHPAKPPAGTKQAGPAAAANGAAKKPARGRGAGRGITPPAKPKGSGARRSGKK
jgi:hypothetical protein